MKKLLLSVTMATMVLSASARGYFSEELSAFEILIYLIVSVILIIAVVKFFQIAKDIRAIREKISPIQETELLNLTNAAAELESGRKSEAISIAQKLMDANPTFSPLYRQAEKFIKDAENSDEKGNHVIPYTNSAPEGSKNSSNTATDNSASKNVILNENAYYEKSETIDKK